MLHKLFCLYYFGNINLVLVSMKQMRKRKAASMNIDTASLLSVFRLLISFLHQAKGNYLRKPRALMIAR